MIVILAALLGCLALSAAPARAALSLTPDMVFTTPEGEPGSSAKVVLAPNTAINGTAAVGPPLAGVPTAQACSTQCRATAGCQLFEWCGVQDGCPLAWLDYQQCQLQTLPACTLQPEVQQTGWPVVTTTGFPARQAPQAVSGFTEEPGHGIVGADFPCPLSVLPGKCAYRRLLDAATMCVDAVECRAVVWYFNGTDGCSEPVGVLKQEDLSSSNAYVAPSVTTLLQEEDLPAVSSRLFLADGEVVLPSEAELEAGVAAAAASGVGLGNDTTWRGCFIGQHAIMDGDVVGLLHGVPSAEACCRACRSLVNASVPACNAFTFCNQTEGCSYADADRGQTYALKASQCQLRWQALVVPGMGWPPTLLAKGPDVPFYAGAPIAVWGPQQEGYERYLGFGLFTYGRFNCSESLQPQLQECALSGPMPFLVDYCNADDKCVGFVLKPGGLYLSAPSVGIFKHATDPSKILFNPTGVLYLREGYDDGLSAGAIAGIAVGAAAGAAALACAAWLVVRRRRRRRAADGLPGKAGIEGGSASSGPWPECDPGSPASPHAAQQQQHLELQPAEQQQVQSVWLAPARASSGSLPSPFAAARAAASTASSEATASARGSVDASRAASGAVSGAASTGAAHGVPVQQRSMDVVPPLQTAPSRRLAPASSLHRAGSRPPLPRGLSSAEGAAVAAWIAAAAPQGAGAGALLGPHTPSQQGGRTGSTLPPHSAHVRGQPQSCSFGRAPSSALTSAASAASPTLGSAAPIAELVQHVAAQDQRAGGIGAAAFSGSGTTSGGSSTGGPTYVPVCAETLPAQLREWVVDPAEVHYCRWPDGRLQELGAGASAHVYRAMLHGEMIAAKEIDIGRSPSMQEAFLTEAVSLHELRHANVVSFFGVTFKRDASGGPDAGVRGVVLMEYAEGRDLHSALELCAAGTDQRLFGWYRRGRRVAYDVAKAINYLHSKSPAVVHMDIKSSNVLLTASGTAKLADVAFARVQHNTYLSDLPLVGTFAWVAPEVLLGGRQCTAAVDMYSFGVVLWEIVTGMRPQRGCMRAPRVPDECPQDVADLIDACLSQDPAERPTATEALQQLGAMLGRRAAGAPSGGAPPPQGATESSADKHAEEGRQGSAALQQ